MTQKQIDKAFEELRSIGFLNYTDEHRKLDTELWCREMINSCLTYNGIQEFWREDPSKPDDPSYAASYVKSLGLDRVRELVAEQEADFAKAKVSYNVYTDSEGLTYNSVEWGDEDGN